MSLYADLHLHSTCSDGTDTPAELIALAKHHGIQVMSITDHDTVAAYRSIDLRGAGIRIIPAIEISTVLRHAMLHILGYYIDPESDALVSYIRFVSAEKTENTRVNFENAITQGCFQYPWERVLELNPDQPRISGVHVVSAMERDNYTIDGMRLWDMFHKYFYPNSPDFIPTETATAYQAIDVIKEAGGISVIAHPVSAGDDAVIADLIRNGAQGLEVYHPDLTVEDTALYLRMAQEHGLYITGGTDWHGRNNSKEITGFGMRGLESADYPILNRL